MSVFTRVVSCLSKLLLNQSQQKLNNNNVVYQQNTFPVKQAKSETKPPLSNTKSAPIICAGKQGKDDKGQKIVQDEALLSKKFSNIQQRHTIKLYNGQLKILELPNGEQLNTIEEEVVVKQIKTPGGGLLEQVRDENGRPYYDV